ncbi:hypothetical protein MYX77_03325 [Acidobacteriia bacterium AH_259_A11_L15]|nr:hypothetical protein [Acidobacteriia bacterium AH_259_A11_L15]
MSLATTELFWRPTFQTLYEAYYQELASEALMRRWQRIDISTSFLVAATASGSAITGWSLWSNPKWQFLWAFIAGLAAVASILHRTMAVPDRLKEQEELRRAFSELRVDLETFRQQLLIGIEPNDANTRYDKLRRRLAQHIGRANPDIGFTIRLRNRVQEQLDDKLRQEGYVDE